MGNKERSQEDSRPFHQQKSSVINQNVSECASCGEGGEGGGGGACDSGSGCSECNCSCRFIDTDNKTQPR